MINKEKIKIGIYVMMKNVKRSNHKDSYNKRINAGIEIVKDILIRQGYTNISYCSEHNVNNFNIILHSITSACDWYPFIRERIKWNIGNYKVIIGGAGVLNVRPFIEYADYFVLGRAENIINKLVDAIANNDEFENKNVINSKSDGKVIAEVMAEPIAKVMANAKQKDSSKVKESKVDERIESNISVCREVTIDGDNVGTHTENNNVFPIPSLDNNSELMARVKKQVAELTKPKQSYSKSEAEPIAKVEQKNSKSEAKVKQKDSKSKTKTLENNDNKFFENQINTDIIEDGTVVENPYFFIKGEEKKYYDNWYEIISKNNPNAGYTNNRIITHKIWITLSEKDHQKCYEKLPEIKEKGCMYNPINYLKERIFDKDFKNKASPVQAKSGNRYFATYGEDGKEVEEC